MTESSDRTELNDGTEFSGTSDVNDATGVSDTTEVNDTTAASVTFPGDTQILLNAKFDAPVNDVYLAWTTPELIGRWWAGNWGQVSSADVDLRPGGTWRYVVAGSDGTETVFVGEYREIVPDERIVSTEMYQGEPDAGALNTVTFTDDGGRTRVELVVQHINHQYRDAHVKSGVEDALLGAMLHLGEVLAAQG
jgi:uncharacterized protein YndB with AHSA1/START domain